jgi:hypothetical protein
MNVRRATQQDALWLLEQVKEFQVAAGFKYPLIKGDIDACAKLLTLIDNHVVFIAVEGEHRRGFIAGYYAPHPFNSDVLVLSETFWWVPLDARKTRAAAMLLDEFIEAGRRMAHWIVLSLEHDSPCRDRHMLKRGFRVVERAFLLEV